MKMILLILIIASFVSCQGRDEPVELNLLTGHDYRIFQSTEVWEFAKAIEDQDIELIEELFKSNNIDINTTDPKYGNTLLMMTLINNQFESFKSLIKFGADVNIHNSFDSTSAIHFACDNLPIGTDLEYIKILLEKGADVNDISNLRYANTPLLQACRKIYSQNSDLETVKYLVSKGADINYTSESDNIFALKVSITFKNYDIALFLIENGADYNRPFYLKDGIIRKENDYIMDVLAYSFVELESQDYLDKMSLINYLEEKGLQYNRLEIIDKWNLIRLKRLYPETWEEYLKVY